MLPVLADENFDARLVRGLLIRLPDLDLVRVQDVGLRATPDDEVLRWATLERRVVLTHDVTTMTRFCIDAVRAGEDVTGVVIVPARLPLGGALDDLQLLVEAGDYEDLRSRVVYLPF